MVVRKVKSPVACTFQQGITEMDGLYDFEERQGAARWASLCSCAIVEALVVAMDSLCHWGGGSGEGWKRVAIL